MEGEPSRSHSGPPGPWNAHLCHQEQQWGGAAVDARQVMVGGWELPQPTPTRQADVPTPWAVGSPARELGGRGEHRLETFPGPTAWAVTACASKWLLCPPPRPPPPPPPQEGMGERGRVCEGGQWGSLPGGPPWALQKGFSWLTGALMEPGSGPSACNRFCGGIPLGPRYSPFAPAVPPPSRSLCSRGRRGRGSRLGECQQQPIN